MSEFELGIRRAAAIYDAGIFGRSVPFFTGMRVSDVERLYTSGYIAHWEELDKDTEILPHMGRFITRALHGDPKLAADLAAYRAAVHGK